MSRIIKIGIFIIPVIISAFLVHFTNVMNDAIFNSNNLLTFTGILLGFGLTLYTFGLSILKDIYDIIDKFNFKHEENKQIIIDELRQTFIEIKSDISIMFLSLISIFVAVILNSIENPLILNVESFRIPEIIKMTVFIYVILCLGDIMKALFDLSNLIFKQGKL